MQKSMPTPCDITILNFRAFQLGEDAARIGVVRYNEDVDVNRQIPMNRFLTNKPGLISAIQALPYNSSGKF